MSRRRSRRERCGRRWARSAWRRRSRRRAARGRSVPMCCSSMPRCPAARGPPSRGNCSSWRPGRMPRGSRSAAVRGDRAEHGLARPGGPGQPLKLVVNAYMSTLIEGVAEAVELARRLGIHVAALDAAIEAARWTHRSQTPSCTRSPAVITRPSSRCSGRSRTSTWPWRRRRAGLPLLAALSRQWHAVVDAGHGREDVSVPASGLARTTPVSMRPRLASGLNDKSTASQVTDPFIPAPDWIRTRALNGNIAPRDRVLAHISGSGAYLGTITPATGDRRPATGARDRLTYLTDISRHCAPCPPWGEGALAPV